MGKDVLHACNDAAKRALYDTRFQGMLDIPTIKSALTRAYKAAAELSEDERTQNGSVLVTPVIPGTIGGRIELRGANCFPGTVTKRQDGDNKYGRIIHAEIDPIARAVRNQEYEVLSRLKDSVLYCPWYACDNCAKHLEAFGIGAIVGHKKILDLTPERWGNIVERGNEVLDEAGIPRFVYEGEIPFSIMFDGKRLTA